METALEIQQNPIHQVIERAREVLAQTDEEREKLARIIRVLEAFAAAVPLDGENPTPEDVFLELAHRFALTLDKTERLTFYQGFDVRLQQLREKGFLR